MLDIIGQCTAPPASGEASALSAGCGFADTVTIRTNCCALISLLATSVLATTTTTATTSFGTTTSSVGTCAAESVNMHPVLRQGIAAFQENDRGEKGGEDEGISPAPTASGGGVLDDWDNFVPMSAKPNPDVVCVVQKKGWAARQQLQRQQPIQHPLKAESNALSGTYGRVKIPQTRTHRAAGTACCSSGYAVNRNNLHHFSKKPRGSSNGLGRNLSSIVYSATSPGKLRKGKAQDKGALLAADSKRTGGNHNDNRRGAQVVKQSPRLDVRELQDRNPHHHHHGFMAGELASPPRLSRIKESGVPGPAPSSLGSSALSVRLHVEDSVSGGIHPHGLPSHENESHRSRTKVG